MAAACSAEGESATTTTTTAGPTTTTAPATTTTAAEPVGVSDDFPRDTIVIDGEELAVAVAATPALRRQGLMFVTDLGDLDGMLFVYTEERILSFWMKDTLIPLDIAFFDAGGGLVGSTTMTPCREDSCPNYVSPAEARYAVEVPAGDFADLAPAAVLEP